MGNQSASRLEGDRYQHLYSWLLILDLLDPRQDVDHIWLEHPLAGAADDVTVHPVRPNEQATRYYQIKWHVDYRSGYSMSSLIDTEENTSSLLRKLWNSWKNLKDRGNITIWLVSNWSPIPNDPLGSLIHARDGKLDAEFLTVSPRTDWGRWRNRWQKHVAANNSEFEAFCHSLRFQLGFASIATLNDMADTKMQLRGLESGEKARSAAIDQVRNWIELGDTHKRITFDALNEALDRLDLWSNAGENVGITIALHTWAVRKYDRQPDYELDWSVHFDHSTRRVPSTGEWNRTLLPELHNLATAISKKNSQRLVKLRGSLCLSSAFAFGQVFSAAGSWQLEIQYRMSVWHTETPPDSNNQLEIIEELGNDAATDILVISSITGNAKPQVLEFVKRQGMSFRTKVYLSPIGGAHDYSISSAEQALAIAQQIRVELRRLVDYYQPKTIHLFYFGPRSLAVLIGHKLNACGTIQLYEFQNPGYVPSCILR